MLEKIKVETDIKKALKKTINNESFAVLCTQGQNQPYGSVVSYVVSEDLKSLVFATMKNTKKYDLMINCDKVAVVFDNRSKFKEDISKLIAITMIGKASKIEDDSEIDSWSARLVQKHPFIESFLNESETVLIQISAEKYQYVSEFQQVHYWEPDNKE